MVTWQRNSIVDRRGSDPVNDVWGGMGFVVIGAVLVLYWLFHLHNWKVLAGGAVLIPLGLYFLRRAWRRVRALTRL